MVKLTNAKIKWIVKHVENGDITTRQAADTYNVSIRRVQQLVKEYRDKGRVPTEYSIQTLQEAQEKARQFNATICEVNTDRGVQFYSTKDKPSKFEKYLKGQGIRYIPSRKSNPQTNGKLERFGMNMINIDLLLKIYSNSLIGTMQGYTVPYGWKLERNQRKHS